MADTPLREAIAEFASHMLSVDEELILNAARKWAELEAEVEKGGRVVVETPCSSCGFTGVRMSEAALQESGNPEVDCPEGGWSEEWVQVCAESRIILGEGATE